jgi:hypothetical protein
MNTKIASTHGAQPPTRVRASAELDARVLLQPSPPPPWRASHSLMLTLQCRCRTPAPRTRPPRAQAPSCTAASFPSQPPRCKPLPHTPAHPLLTGAVRGLGSWAGLSCDFVFECCDDFPSHCKNTPIPILQVKHRHVPLRAHLCPCRLRRGLRALRAPRWRCHRPCRWYV